MDGIRPRFTIAKFLKFTAVVAAILAFVVWTGAFDDASVEALLTALMFPMIIAIALIQRRNRTVQCQSCGRSWFRSRAQETQSDCQHCRMAKLSVSDRQQAQGRAYLKFVLWCFAITVLLLWPFSTIVGIELGPFAFFGVVVGLFVSLMVVFIAVVVLWSIARQRWIGLPGRALATARECAGERGKSTSVGRIAVYTFGQNDPSAMLKAELETCRKRFAAFVGDAIEIDRPLEFFAFGERSAFDHFFQRAFLFVSNLDGAYVPWATPSIAITTEYPDFRLPDPERIVRLLFGYYLLDSYKRCKSPGWVQLGVGNAIAHGGDRDDLARIQRRILPSLSRGTALDTAAFFTDNQRVLMRQIRDWRDHSNFAALTQRTSQSASVMEFLCGRDAPMDGRERFRRFLREIDAKNAPEETFRSHFGYGYDDLLVRWRDWVLKRRVGSHTAPPPHVRIALTEILLPIVHDGHADVSERIHAVREIGRAGYLLGTDTLIAELADGSAIPTEELVWALESISGQVLGDDPAAWAKWFDRLPDPALSDIDYAECS